MPAITTNDLKNGITLELDNGLFTVVEFQHVKPGKGGAFVRTKLKNLESGAVVDKTFRAGEKMPRVHTETKNVQFNAGIRVEQAIVDKREMQFLYRDGGDYVFMDTESYEQQNVAPVALGDAAQYLVEQAKAVLAFFGDEIISCEIPASVELNVTETEPGIQGDRVSGARKPATLETGKTIQVPLFVNIGDRVRVDTRSGDYITRV
jgi:elongation factor P